MKITIKSVFTDKPNGHTITETWECGSKIAAKRTLTDALDLVKKENGTPAAFTREDIARNFERAGIRDDKFVDSEFARQTAMTAVYRKLSHVFDTPKTVRADIDSNNKIIISVRA